MYHSRTYGGNLELGIPGQHFKSSQFLVFSNRLVAIPLAYAVSRLWRGQNPDNGMPFFKYSYASLSNVVSSWCQYEALKFVSFPMQVR